jgi:hypothetical protein
MEAVCFRKQEVKWFPILQVLLHLQVSTREIPSVVLVSENNCHIRGSILLLDFFVQLSADYLSDIVYETMNSWNIPQKS